MGICRIFGAGEHFPPPPALAPGDYVIAADGGWVFAKQLGIRPDLAIGDFDSGPQPDGVPVIALPREKDDTDMAAAIHAGLARGFRLFHLFGGTGGRVDHTLANIQLLAGLAKAGARGFLFGKYSVITAIHNGDARFPAIASGYLSVFAHSGTASGVCLRGLKYGLEDASLTDTRPLGVSNEFSGEPAAVSVRDGTLILVYSKHIQEVGL